MVAGRYAVEMSRALPGAGGGLPAFAARDTEGASVPLMAVQGRTGLPPRAGALTALAGLAGQDVLTPLACGPATMADGRTAWFTICRAPPGPALWSDLAIPVQPWTERSLVLRVLRPAAAALAALAARQTTHRAVRPNNMFSAGATDGVVLGSAWATPPGFLQPALFEPPYLAMCAPAFRGAGTAADDIYALGVCVLALALGHRPLDGMSEDAVIERKLEMGCFNALTVGTKLPPLLADLLSGMLANDPQHRPAPALLADPAAARTRRIAARPQRRATQALQVAGITVWNARMLAYAIARQPEAAVRMLRIGVVDHWLRRALGEAVLAGRLEEPVRQRAHALSASDAEANSLLIMRYVAMLDPLAPLCWSAVALWPDALGPALAAATAGDDASEATAARLGEIVAREAIAGWAAQRPENCDAATLRLDAREYRNTARENGWAGGLARLCYALNPLLSCRSPLLTGAGVALLESVLPALDAAAAREAQRPPLPLDRDSAAFLAARLNGRADAELATLADAQAPGDAMLPQLRVLASVQRDLGGGPVPRLAAWLLAAAAPLPQQWRSASRRTAKQAELAALAAAGDLPLLLLALDSPADRRTDAEGWHRAQAEAQRIDAELAAVAASGKRQMEVGLRLGQETAAAIALTALAVSAVVAAMG